MHIWPRSLINFCNAKEADLGIKAHPHMLRHVCGCALAYRGHDTRSLQAYLGRRNIAHTVRYTELAPDHFKVSGAIKS